MSTREEFDMTHQDDRPVRDPDQSESESKGFRIAKNIFKGLLFGASALVWVLIFWVIISTREPSFYKSMIFTDRTAEAAKANDALPVWQIHVATWMNYDNSISVSGVWYSPDTQELELGFRFNTKLLKRKDEDGISFEDALVYTLTDKDGNPYTAVSVTDTVIGRYHYYRVCYSGVRIDMPETDGTADTEEVLWFRLNRGSDGEPLSSYMEGGVRVNDAEFRIFDDTIVCQRTDYDP